MCTSTTWKLFDLNFHLLVSLGTPVFVLLFLIQIVAVKSYSLQISPRKCDLFMVYDSTVFRQQRVAALFHCGSLITFTDFCIFFLPHNKYHYLEKLCLLLLASSTAWHVSIPKKHGWTLFWKLHSDNQTASWLHSFLIQMSALTMNHVVLLLRPSDVANEASVSHNRTV